MATDLDPDSWQGTRPRAPGASAGHLWVTLTLGTVPSLSLASPLQSTLARGQKTGQPSPAYREGTLLKATKKALRSASKACA